jgi:membrane-associated phospholipid phosphatase
VSKEVRRHGEPVGEALRGASPARPDGEPDHAGPHDDGAGPNDDGAARAAGAGEPRRLSDSRASRRTRLGRAALLTLLLAVPLVLFAVVAEDVAEKQVFAWDARILHSAAAHRTPALTGLMQTITDLGATLSLTAGALALSALLLYRRLHREALFVVLSLGGAALLNALLKQLFQRPRPDIVSSVVTAHGFAFPSGHTMSSMALACAVAFLCWHARWRYRWPVSLGALAFAFLVGVSRVYLGVHYPSDVLAGWLVSLDLVAVIYLLLFRVRPRRGDQARPAAHDSGEHIAAREPPHEAAPRSRHAVGDTGGARGQATNPGGDHGHQA